MGTYSRGSQSLRRLQISVRTTLLLVSILSLGLVGFSAYQDAVKSRSLADSDALRYSREAAVGIDGFFASTRQMLLGASMSPNLRHQEADAATSMLGALLKANPQFANIWATRADGWNYANPLPTPDGKPIYVGDRQYFKDAMSGRLGVESVPDSRQHPGKFSVVICLPVFQDDGTISGTVQAGFEMPQVEKVLSNIHVPSGSTITILDGDGYVLARYPSPETWVGRRVDGAPLWQEMQSSQSGVSEAMLAEGSSELSVFTTTSLAPWRVVVGYPLGAVYHTVEESALRLLLLLALPGLAVAYLAWRLGNLAVENAEVSETVRRQEEFLSALIEHSPVGIAVVEGLKGRHTLANPAYRAIPGANGGGVVGRDFAEVFAVPAEAALAMMERVSTTGATVIAREYKVEAAQGRKDTYWNVEGVPLPPTEEGTSQILLLVQETTEQVRARNEMERLLAEARDSERRFRSIFENSMDPILMTTPGGGILAANPAATQLFGYSEDELRSLGRAAIVDESDPRRAAALEARNRNGRIRAELSYRRKDGTVFEGEVSSVVFHAAGGEVRMVMFIRDITERKRAEAEREQLLAEVDDARRRFEAVVQNSPAGICVWRGDDLVYEMANPAYHAFAPGKRFLGKTYEEVWPEASGESLPLLRRVLETGEPYYVENAPVPMLRRPEGSLEEAFFNISYVKLPPDASGKAGILSMAVDTTEQVRARRRIEELAHEAEANLAKLETIVENMTEGVAIYNADGTPIMLNRALLELHGFEYEGNLEKDFHTMAGRRALRTMDGELVPTEEWPIRRVLRGETIVGFEGRVERVDRPYERVFSYNGAPVTGEDGQVEMAVVTIQDITERKRAEEERERLLTAEQEARSIAEKAVKARDEFISIAAHELKTPVTSLQGFAQIMLRDIRKSGAVDPGRLGKSMERIEQQSKKLTRLTEQLLNLSRLQSGKLTLSREETHLSSLAERVIADIHQTHPGRVIDLRNGGADAVLIDPLRIEQVMVNLLDNAVKFSPSDSRIDVDVAGRETGWVELSVRDRGMGIPEEERPQIFERFFQAHAGQHYGGMGIGLFVSKEIVEMHGGSIRVEQPEDGGSRFVVRLPIRKEDPVSSAPAPTN